MRFEAAVELRKRRGGKCDNSDEREKIPPFLHESVAALDPPVNPPRTIESDDQEVDRTYFDQPVVIRASGRDAFGRCASIFVMNGAARNRPMTREAATNVSLCLKFAAKAAIAAQAVCAAPILSRIMPRPDEHLAESRRGEGEERSGNKDKKQESELHSFVKIDCRLKRQRASAAIVPGAWPFRPVAQRSLSEARMLTRISSQPVTHLMQRGDIHSLTPAPDRLRS